MSELVEVSFVGCIESARFLEIGLLRGRQEKARGTGRFKRFGMPEGLYYEETIIMTFTNEDGRDSASFLENRTGPVWNRMA